MTTRVDQIALHVRKLAQATGVQSEKKGDLIRDPALDGVTSDLDIEALSKGLLDISKDLDLYLQTLVEPPDLPVVNIKAVRSHAACENDLFFTDYFSFKTRAPVCSLAQDIAHLENEIKEKDELLEKTLETIRKAEATFRKLRQRQLRSLYYL